MISRRKFVKMLAAGTATVPAAWAFARATALPDLTIPITVESTEIDLAGIIVKTWAYNGKVPGPEIRLKEGERLCVPVTNSVSDPTLLHWHGISLKNQMDGTRLTQAAIMPNETFTYDFVVPEAGTHWYHSHSGKQADFGLYAPLIVEPRKEELSYDREYVLVLDDWSHGVAPKPKNKSTAGRRANFGGYGQFSAKTSDWNDLEPHISFGGRAYPFYLVNGQPSADPAVFDVRKGDKVRFRIINAAADTAFRFAISGHDLTVTHADGMPVEPVTVKAIRIGMAERYDVIIDTNAPQTAQIGILPEGKRGFGRALLRYKDASRSNIPLIDFQPEELEQRLLNYKDLVGRFPPKVGQGVKPDKIFDMILHATAIEVADLREEAPIIVSKGDIIRFNFKNESKNWHPIHMHGHHFHILNSGFALKDTAVVSSDGGKLSWIWKADNPGAWLMHCHNLYHNKDGMMRIILYESALSKYYNLPEGVNYRDLCI